MMRNTEVLPMGRPVAEFLIEELADEVLVYDEVHHRAHCLAPAAALVWKMCDGKTPVSDARRALAEAGHEVDLNASIAMLEAAGLVSGSTRPRRKIDRSRRALFGKTAVAAGVILASPIVFSIVSPSVAEAASQCGGKNQACCPTPPNCKPAFTCFAGTCR